MFLVVEKQFSGGSPPELLVNLCEFTGHAELSLWRDGLEILKACSKAMRGFETYERYPDFGNLSEFGPSSGTRRREKSAECEGNRR
jgi:hypothetical protein